MEGIEKENGIRWKYSVFGFEDTILNEMEQLLKTYK